MQSRDDLQQVLDMREREFVAHLAPFAGAAIALAVVVLGTISLGEITSINFILGAVIIIFMIIMAWTIGPSLNRAYDRFREAQAELEAYPAETPGAD